MPWPKTGASHYHAQLDLPKTKVVCSNQRVGCLLCSVIRVYEGDRCVGLVPFCGQDGYRAQVLQNPRET